MVIYPAELQLYKSRYVQNTVTNGGRISGLEIPQNVKNDIFPDVSPMERDNRAVIWRKIAEQFGIMCYMRYMRAYNICYDVYAMYAD